MIDLIPQISTSIFDMQAIATTFHITPTAGHVQALVWTLVALALWSFVWKGCALWHAGRHNQKWWFIALLVINTIGILEILCLFVFTPEKNKSSSSVDVSTTPTR